MHRRGKTKLEDKLHDFVPHNLFNFLELLNDRGTELQLSNNVEIMMFPKDILDAKTDYFNLLKNYSEVNIDMITKFEKTYIGK